MKKLSIVVLSFLVVIAFSIPVMAGGAAGAFDNTDVDLALPGKAGSKLCLNSLAYDATNATDDINFYVPTGDTTFITADKAAAATTLQLKGSTGIATDAQVIVVRADGTYAETKALSAISTLFVATIGATDYAYKAGDKLYEAQVMQEFANVGTDANTITIDTGFLCTPKGAPLGAVIDANLMIYMSGFYD